MSALNFNKGLQTASEVVIKTADIWAYKQLHLYFYEWSLNVTIHPLCINMGLSMFFDLCKNIEKNLYISTTRIKWIIVQDG